MEKVSFDTVDEVELHGAYFPSAQGIKAPCALVLHDVGSNSQQKGLVELAKKLQHQGFAVLTFDFRGHGASTAVTPAFWRVSANMKIKGANAKKSDINHKDFPSQYYPNLVNDIAAARRFLDQRNDARECNTSNLFLIAPQEGATIGTLWLAAEWQRRPRRKPGTQGLPPFGQDVAAAVWLSVSPTMNGSRFPQINVDNWLRPLREKTPMAFLFGEDDKRQTDFSTHLCEQVLKANVPPRLKLTATLGLKSKAAGADLILKVPGTDDKILSYLNKVLEARDDTMQVWQDRETKKAMLDFMPLKSLGFNSP